jgi:hypothetical protein
MAANPIKDYQPGNTMIISLMISIAHICASSDATVATTRTVAADQRMVVVARSRVICYIC